VAGAMIEAAKALEHEALSACVISKSFFNDHPTRQEKGQL
jgi:hypothetical protein